MKKYVCKNCNYKFEMESSIDCPYCGLGNFEEEKDAGGLIEEVEWLLKS